MKHPDEYAWELVHGLEEGDAHRDYIEEHRDYIEGYKNNEYYAITRDGLRYVEKFIRKIMAENDRATKNR